MLFLSTISLTSKLPGTTNDSDRSVIHIQCIYLPQLSTQFHTFRLFESEFVRSVPLHMPSTIPRYLSTIYNILTLNHLS